MARLTVYAPWRDYLQGMGDALRRSQGAAHKLREAAAARNLRRRATRPARPAAQVARSRVAELALNGVRRAVFGIDAVQRARHHVIEFTDDERCILRISRCRAHADCALSDGSIIRAGDPLIEIHYWNERVPEMPPDGPSLTWAVRFNACFRASLEDIAELISTREEYQDIVAIRGETSFATDQERQTYLSLGRRMGFDMMPSHLSGVLGRTGAFFISLYVWIIVWAVHPAGVRGKGLISAERTDLWMSRGKLMRKYGGKYGGEHGGEHGARQCGASEIEIGRAA